MEHTTIKDLFGLVGQRTYLKNQYIFLPAQGRRIYFILAARRDSYETKTAFATLPWILSTQQG